MLALISKYWQIAALALAFGSGWMANGWRHEAQIADMQREYAKQAQKAVNEIAKKQAFLAAQAALIDEKHTKEVKRCPERN